MKSIAAFIFLLLLFTIRVSAQSWYEAGSFNPGKVRIIKDTFHITDNENFPLHEIRYRAFSADSITDYEDFGNHYSRLRKIIGKDPIPAVYLYNAVGWEKTQRYFIAGAILFGAATCIVSSSRTIDQSQPIWMFKTEIGLGGGILFSYFCKRHWANKAMRTWNKDLDNNKFHFVP